MTNNSSFVSDIENYSRLLIKQQTLEKLKKDSVIQVGASDPSRFVCIFLVGQEKEEVLAVLRAKLTDELAEIAKRLKITKTDPIDTDPAP